MSLGLMSPSDIGFPMNVARINMFNALRGFGLSYHEHVSTCGIHRHETLLVHHSAPNVKLYRIFVVKVGHFRYCILIVKAW